MNNYSKRKKLNEAILNLAKYQRRYYKKDKEVADIETKSLLRQILVTKCYIQISLLLQNITMPIEEDGFLISGTQCTKFSKIYHSTTMEGRIRSMRESQTQFYEVDYSIIVDNNIGVPIEIFHLHENLDIIIFANKINSNICAHKLTLQVRNYHLLFV